MGIRRETKRVTGLTLEPTDSAEVYDAVIGEDLMRSTRTKRAIVPLP